MIQLVAQVLTKIIGLLPEFDCVSYVKGMADSLAPYLGWLNWLVPFYLFKEILLAWCACMAAFFAYINLKPIVMRLISKHL